MRLATVITVSDRSARGDRADVSGPVAVGILRDAGWQCEAVVIPDGAASVEAALRAAVQGGSRLVITSGGTGVGPRDETPEGTLRMLEKQLPGIAEELRRVGAAAKPAGMLSRGVAGVSAGALVVNLPGSPAAAASGVPVVLSVAAHVIDQLAGGDH
jgi:molybdenum cofactor synthesis domain-containing protein